MDRLGFVRTETKEKRRNTLPDFYLTAKRFILRA